MCAAALCVPTLNMRCLKSGSMMAMMAMRVLLLGSTNGGVASCGGDAYRGCAWEGGCAGGKRHVHHVHRRNKP